MEQGNNQVNQVNGDEVMDVLLADYAALKRENVVLRVQHSELQRAHVTLAKGYKVLEAKLQKFENNLPKEEKANGNEDSSN
jgi:hypothetical protein